MHCGPGHSPRIPAGPGYVSRLPGHLGGQGRTHRPAHPSSPGPLPGAHPRGGVQ